jgi:hypothetical protein
MQRLQQSSVQCRRKEEEVLSEVNTFLKSFNPKATEGKTACFFGEKNCILTVYNVWIDE